MKSVMVAIVLGFVAAASGKVVDFEADAGGVAEKNDANTWSHNQKTMSAALGSLNPGDRLIIPNRTFYVMGGIQANNVKSVTIQIDGTLKFAASKKLWPRKSGKVLDCLSGTGWKDVTFTSSGTGTLDGQGSTWWGPPGIGYLEVGENRPKLIHLRHGQGLLFENIFFKDSGYWNFHMQNVNGLEVRHCSIDARRTSSDGHSTIDLTAFNTDGFDVSGSNVWIHDCSIWSQDDSIAVKDNSENMVFERLQASGMGLSIGSIGSSTVRNITFRDVHMHKTVKGIYTKFRDGTGAIKDVTYENIVMDEPEQFAIWIGPAQQSDSKNLCAAHPCSICWPTTPFTKCHMPVDSQYTNIVLRNITVNSAKKSPGVIMGGDNAPIQGLVFEDVKFNNPGSRPFGGNFHCENVRKGVAKGSTSPIPACFKDETTSHGMSTPHSEVVV